MDALTVLKELKVDPRYVTIRKDAALINNQRRSRFSKGKQDEFEERTGIRVVRSDAFMDICQKMARTVSEHQMIKPKDKVLVGFSGGKDSLVLLNCLEPYRRKYGIDLVAATVDLKVGHQTPWMEGSDGHYLITENCKALSIEHHHLKPDYDSLELTDELNELAKNGQKYSPCFTCSHLRRSLLTHLAEEIGAASIAFAHTLDDNSDTILASLLKGEKLYPLKPVKDFDESFLQLKDSRIALRPSRIIRPVIEAPEKLIIRALKELEIPYYDDKKKCLYSREWGDSIRKRAHNIIEEVEKDVPNVREMMVASGRKSE